MVDVGCQLMMDVTWCWMSDVCWCWISDVSWWWMTNVHWWWMADDGRCQCQNKLSQQFSKNSQSGWMTLGSPWDLELLKDPQLGPPHAAATTKVRAPICNVIGSTLWGLNQPGGWWAPLRNPPAFRLAFLAWLLRLPHSGSGHPRLSSFFSYDARNWMVCQDVWKIQLFPNQKQLFDALLLLIFLTRISGPYGPSF